MRDLPAPARRARVAPRGLLVTRQNRRLRRARASRSLGDRIRRLGAALRASARPLGFVLVAGALAVGAVRLARFAMTSPRFAVREIRIEGARRAGSDELRGRIGIEPGANVFRVRLGDVVRDVRSSPWVQKARARRELPGRIVVEVVEYEPRALALLGHLYLVDGDGHVFKRAAPEETAGLPVVTGLDRVDFVSDRAAGEARLREAVAFLDEYRRRGRPELAEIHLEPTGRPTLYTRDGAVQIRLGDGPLDRRLARLDVVWAALGPEARRVRAIYLDHRTRQDRVTVRVADSGVP